MSDAAASPLFATYPVDAGARQVTEQMTFEERAPTYLSYLMGPVALVAILILMHFGAIEQEPAWVWVGVFIAIPATSLGAESLRRSHPCATTTHLRIAMHAAAVTAVIYLTGWGPVLWGAFAFIALENISHGGSAAWRARRGPVESDRHRRWADADRRRRDAQ